MHQSAKEISIDQVSIISDESAEDFVEEPTVLSLGKQKQSNPINTPKASNQLSHTKTKPIDEKESKEEGNPLFFVRSIKKIGEKEQISENKVKENQNAHNGDHQSEISGTKIKEKLNHDARNSNISNKVLDFISSQNMTAIQTSPAKIPKEEKKTTNLSAPNSVEKDKHEGKSEGKTEGVKSRGRPRKRHAHSASNPQQTAFEEPKEDIERNEEQGLPTTSTSTSIGKNTLIPLKEVDRSIEAFSMSFNLPRSEISEIFDVCSLDIQKIRKMLLKKVLIGLVDSN